MLLNPGVGKAGDGTERSTLGSFFIFFSQVTLINTTPGFLKVLHVFYFVLFLVAFKYSCPAPDSLLLHSKDEPMYTYTDL